MYIISAQVKWWHFFILWCIKSFKNVKYNIPQTNHMSLNDCVNDPKTNENHPHSKGNLIKRWDYDRFCWSFWGGMKKKKKDSICLLNFKLFLIFLFNSASIFKCLSHSHRSSDDWISARVHCSFSMDVHWLLKDVKCGMCAGLILFTKCFLSLKCLLSEVEGVSSTIASWG